MTRVFFLLFFFFWNVSTLEGCQSRKTLGLEYKKNWVVSWPPFKAMWPWEVHLNALSNYSFPTYKMGGTILRGDGECGEEVIVIKTWNSAWHLINTWQMYLFLRQVFLLRLLDLCHQHRFRWPLWDDAEWKECVRARAAVSMQDEVWGPRFLCRTSSTFTTSWRLAKREERELGQT